MKKIFAANWKLHKTPTETRNFFSEWKDLTSGFDFLNSEIVFFPTTICLESTAECAKGANWQWGAQNAYSELKGAFTGETSVATLQTLGAKWCLVGHSERRSLFAEDDQLIAKKIAQIQLAGLTPLFCIGESLSERQSGRTFEVLQSQIDKGLSLANKTLPVVIAYEPVWAIGTGVVAEPAQVQEAHAKIFAMIEKLGFKNPIPILYGGSVKADNASGLIQISHVDGFLVGGASLEPNSFFAIAKA